jgi:hypothetical protein
MNDFSKKTIRQLSAKGISVVGKQAIPAFEGDKYFSGVAYELVYKGTMFIRTFQQVLCNAASSWNPETDLDISAN